jgi:hypothetical protein
MVPIQEDLSSQRQMRFRIEGGPPVLHIFKARGESAHQACLKALSYAFWREYGPLTFDPSTDYKSNPSVACLDLTGEVRLWVHVGPWALDKIEYVLRHTDAQEVCWAFEGPAGSTEAELAEECAQWVARIKRHIHYRYTTKKLRLLIFTPLDTWFDPENVALPATEYVYYSF